MTADYKNTLNLPQTAFEMRANLHQKEPEMLARWAEMGLWEAMRSSRAGAPSFVLHDGPPYANGALHHGHILNKVLKDFIVRDRAMAGLQVSYVPGWDCHGLPIEQQVDKELGAQKAFMTPAQISAACRAYANRFIDSQKTAFMRLGVQGDWQDPYRTMDAAYEAQIMREMVELMAGELIYKSLRPVHWCTVHKTALAEAEVEYADKVSPSIYVAITLEPAAPISQLSQPVQMVVWTTTPWSLPGNVAIAVHPDLDYVVYRLHDTHVMVAEVLLPPFLAALQDTRAEGLSDRAVDSERIVARFKGAELDGLTYQHPFLPRQGVVVADAMVEADAGTGCVHSAPAHGVEDFALGKRRSLTVVSPVGADGRLNQEAGPFAGQSLKEAGANIIAHLDAQRALMSHPERTLTHRYAHCWRCHKPLITRATEQWFMAMDVPYGGGKTLRERAMESLEQVQWIPKWGVDRIGGMLAGRPDWCLSRQRTWGVPIPVVYCEGCNAPFVSPEHMRRVADRVAQEGASAWATHDVATLFGSISCSQCGHQGAHGWRKETDILDVWFDSGVSYAAVLEARGIGHKEGPPADLYLEGSDQHRGWFHSSLLTSLATRKRPPYKAVLTHGFVMDGQGRKISKSLGNFTDPFKHIAENGAELWRLWAASEDYQQDVRISPEILRQLGDSYRKIRNTVRYLLGNLNDFDWQAHAVAWDELQLLDQWAVVQANDVQRHMQTAFEQYNFHSSMQRLMQWCNVELSAFYLDVIKDRLYASAANSRARRSAQTAMYLILNDLVRLMAPVFCFTSEEAYGAMNKATGSPPSVHLTRYPGGDDDDAMALLRTRAAADASEVTKRFGHFFAVRPQATQALETARRGKEIGASVQAQVTFVGSAQALQNLEAFDDATWAELLIVSEVSRKTVQGDDALTVHIAPALGQKCPRCWLLRPLIARSQTSDDAVCARCNEAIS